MINALKTKRPPSRFAPKRNTLTPPSLHRKTSPFLPPFVAQATIALGQIQLAQFFIVSLVPLSANRANPSSSALVYCCCCCFCCCCTGNCSLAAAQGCCILKNHQVAWSLCQVGASCGQPCGGLLWPSMAWSALAWDLIQCLDIYKLHSIYTQHESVIFTFLQSGE